ncbi:MAG: aminotransferase class V-fold PLP-dependent enzyme [Alphaproteobacteria bacterium]|nr:aminotransferase class V-fold PLP-dependent enzyme [Alphaproteobacteria bacterium]
MRDLKHHFRHALGREGAPLHFAAHSHHPWPDVTRDAQLEYWDVSARLLDGKWGQIFEHVIPEAQGHVAHHLGLSDPGTICFSSNTHDFLLRILSSMPTGRVLRILSTDSEFHSFTRQAARLEEEGLVEVTRIPVAPFDSFATRFAEAAASRPDGDLVWLSHVFFNTGQVLSGEALQSIVAAVPRRETVIVLDGYHSFMAMPVNLAPLASRVFYLSGGYKYAMAGEGVCFMHCPDGYIPRPRATGWYAEFGALEKPRDGSVAYGPGGSRFLGATFDPSGLYRLNAVMRWLDEIRQDCTTMTAHCTALQQQFLARLATSPHPTWKLIEPDPARRGRFLAFRTPKAPAIDEGLKARRVIVDHRGDILRIGFGLYQVESDLDHLVGALASLET